jgi:hypothetical protein
MDFKPLECLTDSMRIYAQRFCMLAKQFRRVVSSSHMKRRGGRVRKSGASRMRGVGVGGRRMCLPAVTPGDSAGGGEMADSRKSYTLGCISTFLCTVQ